MNKIEPVLNWLGTVTISATTEPFVANKKFVLGSTEVKFSFISENFRSWFLGGDGKVEEPAGEQTLRYGDLTKDSVSGPIINDLGGEAKAETTLTELYDLLKKQGYGEEGVLLTSGRANIFYIKGISGLLRTVSVYWHGDGWDVYANSVENPDGWRAGVRVFSRNS